MGGIMVIESIMLRFLQSILSLMDLKNMFYWLLNPFHPDDQSAEEHKDFLLSTLACYKKTQESILFLVGDNTNLNPAIADLLEVPHLGCASHRLNLGVKSLLHPRSFLLDMIQNLMKKLCNKKFNAR